MNPKLTVWYNTKCPVCNAGIAWQRKRLVRAARAGAIEFRDINLEPAALVRFGAGLEDVRRRLHAVDADGPTVCGRRLRDRDLAANPGRRLARPVARLAGDPSRSRRLGYDRFADLLYAWSRRKRHW